MMYKLPLAFLVASAILAVVSHGKDQERSLEIDEIRDEIMQSLTKQRSDLKEYAANLLTGSAEKVPTGKEACIIHSMRQFAVAAEALRFLGKQRALVAAYQIISTRFDPTSPKSMRESLKRQGEQVEQYNVLYRRAKLRGLASGSKASRAMLSLLYLTVKDNYALVKTNKEALQVATDAFNHAKAQRDSLEAAHREQMQALNDWEDRGILLGKTQGSIEQALQETDDRLDTATFYTGDKEKDPTLYGAYPILHQEYIRFWLTNELEKAIGFNVSDCEGVREFDPDEVASVGRDQFISLMLKFSQDTKQSIGSNQRSPIKNIAIHYR